MDLLLSSTALSLLAVAAVWMAGRRDPARSPLLTLGCLLALLSLPLLAQLPKVELEVPAAVAAQEAPLGVSTISWLAIIWTIGFLLFSLRFAADAIGLRRWSRDAIPVEHPGVLALAEECRRQMGVHRRVRVALHPGAVSPSVAGLLRPTIFLPTASATWSHETLRMVLLHELCHVSRRDLWTLITARLSCLVHWFNPLVWWLRRRLVAQCEFACDAKVISSGADPAHYAHALCDIAENGCNTMRTPSAALAMADRASLRKRVERLAGSPRANGSLLVGTALLLTVSASLALSVVRLAGPIADLAAPAAPHPAQHYTPEEIEMRFNANPFPAD